MRNLYYILNGKQIVPEPDLLSWGKWFQTADRHIAQTVVGNYEVSTVFLGLDHGWGRNGPPVLFETMVFSFPRPPVEEILSGYHIEKHEFSSFQERYCTYEEAEAGHRKVC